MRELRAAGIVTLVLVPTKDMSADVLTKPLDDETFKRHSGTQSNCSLRCEDLSLQPLPLLGLAQLASASALLAYRGRDLARSSGIVSSSGEDSALRRRLAYLVLLASISAVPAKGLAHLLPDARRKRLVLA